MTYLEVFTNFSSSRDLQLVLLLQFVFQPQCSYAVDETTFSIQAPHFPEFAFNLPVVMADTQNIGQP
jgi:hypothetical protein